MTTRKRNFGKSLLAALYLVLATGGYALHLLPGMGHGAGTGNDRNAGSCTPCSCLAHCCPQLEARETRGSNSPATVPTSGPSSSPSSDGCPICEFLAVNQATATPQVEIISERCITPQLFTLPTLVEQSSHWQWPARGPPVLG